MALLHDIGDTLGAFNHPDIAAAILKPLLSEENLWIVQHHGIFQGHYFFHYIGLDRDMRDQFRDHPYAAACADFCEISDQLAGSAGRREGKVCVSTCSQRWSLFRETKHQ